MLPVDRMVARQAAAREIAHPELGTYGRLFTPVGFTSTPGPVNLVTNPSLETNTTGWINGLNFYVQSGSTLTQDATAFQFGTKSLKVVTGAQSLQGVAMDPIANPPDTAVFKAGTKYTFSVYLKGNAGGELVALALGWDVNATDRGTQNITLTTAMVRYAVEWTPSADRASVCIAVFNQNATANTYFLDGAMVVTSPLASNPTYFDGSTTGFSWTGTANASTSQGPATNPQPTGVSKYGQAGWAYDITEAFFDNGVQTQDWDLARVLRNSGLFVESDGAVVVVHVFSPADVPGLLGWWDFSTLAGNDGDLIASVSDLSGNGHTFTQATGGNKPVLRKAANGINGLSVAQFDGGASFMATAAFASPTAGVTALIVLKWSSAVTAYKDVFLHVAAVGSWVSPYARWAIRESGASGKMSVFVEDGSINPGNYADATAALTTNAEVHGLRYNQTTINHYKDGVVDGTNSKSGALTSSNQPVYLGCEPVPGEFADVKVGEALYFDNGVSDANLALLSTYFRNKWATA